MADQPGTLERIATEVGLAFAPLQDVLAQQNLQQLLLELGLDSPPDLSGNSAFSQKLSQVVQQVLAVDSSVTQLIDAAQQANSSQTISAAAAVVQAIAGLGTDLDALATELKNAAAGLPDVAAFAALLVERLLGDSVIRYLELAHPIALRVLALTGLVELTPVDAILAGQPISIVRRQLHLDRFGQLIQDPLGSAKSLYGWGTETFNSALLFQRVRDVFQSLGLLAGSEDADAEGPPALDLFGVAFTVANTHPPGIEGEEFTEFKDSVDLTLAQLSDEWRVALQVSAGLGAGFIVRLLPPVTGQLDADAAISGDVKLLIIGQASNPALPFTVLGETGGSGLQAQQVQAGLGAGLKWDAAANKATADVSVDARITQGKLIIDLSKADSFLTSVLPADGFQLDFDLALGWSILRGFHIDGGAALEIALPLHVSIGPASLQLLYLKLKVAGDRLALEASLAAGVTLGPIAASVDRLGLSSKVVFTRGNLGPVDFGIGFKPPNGLGIAIDAGVVAGGGYVLFNPDEGQYAGVLDVAFAEIIQVKIIGVLDTILPDGSHGFSFLLIITFDFPPIQLGFGFTLNGVGGLGGVNRTMNTDALHAGFRAHTLDSILFPPDPIANAPQIISNLENFFPPADGRYLFGPMLEIGWGTPTLITLAVGVILEVPDPVRLALLGLIDAGLPTTEVALIELHIDVLGILDFGTKKLSIDGSLYDSRVLIFSLAGDLALRLSWGNNPNFLFSLGGFNPHFNTNGLDVPLMHRCSISIGNGDNPRISANSYFAITSNSLQFGANVEAYASAAGFAIHGYLGFDVLIIYSPFSFEIDFAAGFGVSFEGLTLLSLNVDGMLSGPRPWHLHGDASIDILFFSISVSLDITWGDRTPVILPQKPVLPDLTAALQDPRNWSAALPDRTTQAVTLSTPKPDDKTLRVHPIGTLIVRENVVPLDLPITRYGNATPSDGNYFSISDVQIDGNEENKQPFQDYFAAGQFLTLSDADKVSRPSFEKYDAGITIGSSEILSGQDSPRNVFYEERYIDTPSGFSRFSRRYAMAADVHLALTRQGAGFASPLKNTGLFKYGTGTSGPAIETQDPGYVVTHVEDLSVRSDVVSASGSTYFQARAALDSYVSLHPEEESNLQILPLHEVAP